jgi:hypothetical protein
MSLKPFRSWSHWIALGFFVLVGLFKTMPVAAQAQTKSYPVSLELLAPTSSGNKIPTVTWGGWPLVLRMSANEEIGIQTYFRAADPLRYTEFPVYGETGLIVLEEPTSSEGRGFWFTPGTQVCPLDFLRVTGCRAGSVWSLVLLSDVGPGQGGINLAKYVTNVGYELDDTGHRTNVVASLMAPNGFVSPSVTAVDYCVGTPSAGSACFNPFGMLGTQTLSFPALVELLNTNNVATLRAFVVSLRHSQLFGLNPPGPTVIRDLDGDGVIGAKDAELTGYELLSREVVFQVRTLHQEGELFYAPRSDLDGNGQSDCGSREVECGPGGGRLTPVPR